MKQEPVDPTVSAAIEATIREAMTPFGYRSTDVQPGLDHDDDPVLFVHVAYDDSRVPLDPKVLAELTHAVRRTAWQHGEERFPHIRHHFDPHRELVDVD